MTTEPPWNVRVEGHIEIEASEWFAERDESWPEGDRRSVDLRPFGDDLFNPHFSIGIMGTREELRALAAKLAAAAD